MEKQEKTKYKLAAAMKECMKTTPVDRITVTSIVEGAGVTRQTFYRNFLDKYDLINWYFDKLVLKSFEQIGVSHTIGESLTQKLEFIQEEKAFFTEAFRSDDRNSVKETAGGRIAVPFRDVLSGVRVYDGEMDSDRHEGHSGSHGCEAGGGDAAEAGEGYGGTGVGISNIAQDS